MKLTIAPKGDKGRAFSAHMVAFAEADFMWERGQASDDAHRPIWMALAGSEQEVRVFVANILSGHSAVGSSSRYKVEVLKSARFMQHSTPLAGGGMVTMLYHPEFFQINPGMVDPDFIKFVVIPSKTWVDAQEFDLVEATTLIEQMSNQPWQKTADDLRDLLAEGVLLLSYLNPRTRQPIPSHSVFGAWLLLACQARGIVHRTSQDWRANFVSHNTGRVNALPGFAFYADHAQFERVLAVEVRTWFDAIRRVEMTELWDWLDGMSSDGT